MKLIRGARVTPTKAHLAHELRRQMTDAETSLWNALRANQLDGLHFRRQQVIEGFIADFYCHARRLVVEVDGSVHDLAQEYDAERDKVLTDHGLRILRITNEQVLKDLPGALDAIRAQAALASTPSLERSGREGARG